MKKAIVFLFLGLAACGGSGSSADREPAAQLAGSEEILGAWCHDFVQGDPQIEVRETQVFQSNGVTVSEVREIASRKTLSRTEMAWATAKGGRIEIFFPGAETNVSFKPMFKKKNGRECFTAEDRRLNGKPEPRSTGAAPVQKCRCN